MAAAFEPATLPASEGPPVIDAQGFLAPGARGPPPPAVGSAVAAASRTYGFFQLVNHGSDLSKLQRMVAAMQVFFDLPLQDKLQVRRTATNAMGYAHDELTKQTRDLKEVFDLCRVPHPELPDAHPDNAALDGHNQWPPGQPEFEAAMKAYFGEMERCAFRLLEAFCAGLGLDREALHPLFVGQHTSFMRLNFYPALKADPQAAALQAELERAGRPALGVNQHTDAGFMTLLYQDPEVPGLQMLGPDGRWLTVEPMRGALTINVGDMCQVLSNDRFKAPLHRVLASVEQQRVSAPFFFNPRPDADIAPLPRFVDAQHPPAFRPINWGEFRSKRYAGDYTDQGEEVQISHYRTAAGGAAAAGGGGGGAAA